MAEVPPEPLTGTRMLTGELSVGKPRQTHPEKDKGKDWGAFLDLLAKSTLQEAGENGMKLTGHLVF